MINCIEPIVERISDSPELNKMNNDNLIMVGLQRNKQPDSKYENELIDTSEETLNIYFKTLHYLKFLYKENKRHKNIIAANMIAIRNKIVNSNLGFVKFVALKLNYPLIYSDLLSEGNEMLIGVVNRYDPWKGTKFSYFAFTSLYKSMQKFAAKMRKNQEKIHENSFDLNSFRYNVEDSLYVQHLRKMLEQNRNGQFKNFDLKKREAKAIELMFLSGREYDYPSLGKQMHCTKQRAHHLVKSGLLKIKQVLVEDPAFRELEQLSINKEN